MTHPKRPKRVREQLQIYLDPPDKALLEELVRATGLPRTELFRRGLRGLAQAALGERAPGWSLDRLVGSLGDGPDLPADLAAHHDAYLYAPHAAPRGASHGPTVARRLGERRVPPEGAPRGKPRPR
jgi:hypothetical protein